MSDDNPMPPGADDEGVPRPFGIAMPPELVAMMTAQHDAAHARHDVAEADAWRFLEGLDVEGLRALSWMMRVGTDGDYALANNHRWMGVTETMLRARGVDPATGLPWGAELTEGADAPPAT